MKLLVAGTNIRNVAESARKAGYEVYALTKYVDEDLKLYAKVEKIPDTRQEAKKKIEEIAENLKAKVILGAGYEDLSVDADVIGTDPVEARKIRDKLKFYRTLEKAGIPFPELVHSEDSKVICKPRFGGGGENTFLADGVCNNNQKSDSFVFQRYIEGVPCSVSLIAGRNIEFVAVNEILAGWNEMNADGFRYCGNLTPFIGKSEDLRDLIQTAIETAELFDLKGSIGVDFILADKPYILEINPRFQGSLDSIEWSCDVNLFRLHMLAIEGKGIEAPKPNRYAVRAILFAEKETEIKTNLAGNPFFADIPPAGLYDKCAPLVSILASGYSRDEVLKKILERKKYFLSFYQ